MLCHRSPQPFRKHRHPLRGLNTVMFNFEKLETWHEAIAFADLVYQLTRKFPYQQVYQAAEKQSRMLSGLKRSLESA